MVMFIFSVKIRLSNKLAICSTENSLKLLSQEELFLAQNVPKDVWCPGSLGSLERSPSSSLIKAWASREAGEGRGGRGGWCRAGMGRRKVEEWGKGGGQKGYDGKGGEEKGTKRRGKEVGEGLGIVQF